MGLARIRAARALVALTGVLLATACQFPPLPPLDVDAASVDAPPVQYRLTITIDGASTGTGTVLVEPSGFTCTTGTCSRTFEAGADLTVTVTGASALDGVAMISGDCQASPCELAALGGDRSIVVRFVRYECVPLTQTCTADAYTECGADGRYVTHVIPNGAVDGTQTMLTMRDHVCPMGCHASEPRCADIALGNGIEAAFDAPEVSPAGIDLVVPRPAAPPGVVRVNTDAFDAPSGILQLTDTDGTLVNVPAMLVDQPGDAPPVLVLKVRTFTVRAGSTLRAYGNVALGIASHFDVYIGGTLDLSGALAMSTYEAGAGGVVTGTACPGQTFPSTSGAGGGGGAACGGGASSTGHAGIAAQLIAAPYVMGGCGGARGSNFLQFASPPGGGLLLASRTRVAVAGTAAIDLTGAGGVGAAGYGGGGAAGGNLVVMAPVVSIASGTGVVARGGSGGAGGPSMGVQGNDGPLLGTARAAGVTCTGCGTSGAGGYESQCSGAAAQGTGTAVAGGGGALGSCTVYTRLGALAVDAASMKCSYEPELLDAR